MLKNLLLSIFFLFNGNNLENSEVFPPIPIDYFPFLYEPIRGIPQDFLDAERGDTITLTYSIAKKGSIITGNYNVPTQDYDTYNTIDTSLVARDMEELLPIPILDKYLNRAFSHIAKAVEFDSGITLLLKPASINRVEKNIRYLTYGSFYRKDRGIGDIVIALTDIPDKNESLPQATDVIAYSYFWNTGKCIDELSDKSYTMELDINTDFMWDDEMMGISDPKGISLEHLLTHELLHMIAGCGHVPNPESIMWPSVGDGVKFSDRYPNGLETSYAVRTLLRRIFG